MSSSQGNHQPKRITWEILSLHLSPNDVDFHLLSITHRLGRPMASFKSPIQSLLPVRPWTYQWASWGEWQHPERLTARFTVMTQEKCLAFICSFTAPTFTLLIEEMLLLNTSWRCGWYFILHTVYRKAPSHFQLLPLLSVIPKPPHSTWYNLFFFFLLFIYLTVGS